MKNVLFGCSCDCIWNKNNDIAWFSVNMIFLTKWNILRCKNTILWFQQLYYTPEISGDIDGKEKTEEKRSELTGYEISAMMHDPTDKSSIR